MTLEQNNENPGLSYTSIDNLNQTKYYLLSETISIYSVGRCKLYITHRDVYGFQVERVISSVESLKTKMLDPFLKISVRVFQSIRK